MNGWTFYYQGWHHHLDNGDFWRKNATRDNIFPPERKSELDAELLKKMRLARERMVSKDALFFIQLLFSLHDPKHSGIEDDPRMDFYEDVAVQTNIYASGKAKHGLRKHAFCNTNAEDHVHWDGIVIRNNNKTWPTVGMIPRRMLLIQSLPTQ